jgi:putative transposase
MAISFKGAHLPQDIILMGMRWYVAYPWSYRHVEELREERGVAVDHATIQRWVVKYGPQLEEAFHRRKPPVWISWRMDETYMQVKGSGGISIVPSTNTARPFTSSSRNIETQRRHCGF